MKQKGLKIFGTAAIILYLLCGISNILTGDWGWQYHAALCYQIGTGVLAIIYMLKSCTKDAAKYYHWFTVSFMILEGMSILIMMHTGQSDISMVFAIVAYGFSVLLAFAKDLGKKVSHYYVGMIFLLNFGGLLIKIIAHGIADGDMVGTGCLAFYALILFACVHGKYVDKEARGTR